MIDFQAIRNELNKISDFIGGEKYIQFKTSDNINVYNKYDLESNNLIVNKEKLLLYKKQLAYMLTVNYMRLIKVNPYNTRCSKLAHLIGELNKTYLMVAKSCLSLSHKMTILRILTRI